MRSNFPPSVVEIEVFQAQIIRPWVAASGPEVVCPLALSFVRFDFITQHASLWTRESSKGIYRAFMFRE